MSQTLELLGGFLGLASIAVLGYVLAATGVLTAATGLAGAGGDPSRQSVAQEALTRLCFFVTMPAVMFTSIVHSDGEVFGRLALVTRAVPVVFIAATFALARWRGQAAAPAMIAALGAGYSNSANIGIPVPNLLLGSASFVAPVQLVQQLLLTPIALAVLGAANTSVKTVAGRADGSTNGRADAPAGGNADNVPAARAEAPSRPGAAPSAASAACAEPPASHPAEGAPAARAAAPPAAHAAPCAVPAGAHPVPAVPREGRDGGSFAGAGQTHPLAAKSGWPEQAGWAGTSSTQAALMGAAPPEKSGRAARIMRGFLNVAPFKHPPVIAVLVAVGVSLAGWEIPAWIMRPIDMLAAAAIPLMLLVLGMAMLSPGRTARG
ncbi:MAG: AEC family transporter [Buchananella hordeovulneris]|nr:AEC family transporter [Buchananella hordeovulneris]